MGQGQKRVKLSKKETATVHVEMPVDLEQWLKKKADETDRSVRRMVLALLKEARERDK
jgi:hypothetical protein